ncbi:MULTISPECIES: tetratricopeptide repeat protein [unclassified Streptomyces]|uniref:tetratricopeptide repeat protein n=1 Tax=unclassified Streptomyces TaxID=2593676 RepID=UPI001CB6D4C9|nr:MULTISPECIES: tetratricopeptide repeat protein [unclassified Streptomyces]
MKTQNVSRAVLLGGAGAVFAATALLYVPGLVGRGPPPPPGPVERAVLAAHAGAPAALPDLAALIADREEWLRAHPDDDASWARLGAAYTERGTRLGDVRDYPRAERALRRSLAGRPAARGNLDAQLGLGALAGARGDWRAAKEWGERVRKADPKRWPVYPVLIDAYNGLGEYGAARKAVESLEGLRSGALVRAALAGSYRDRGWREDADAAALDAAALAGTDAERTPALVRLGDLAWERGEPEEALTRYGAALRLVPGHGPALAGRARALAGLGRTEEALREWRAVLARRPAPQDVLDAGELHEAAGLDGAAEALYERLRSGDWPTAGVPRALLDADHGDPDAAVARMRAEWARGHRSVRVADALGWALLRAGRAGEALGYAKRATDEGLRSALFTYHRGEIERALEQEGPARRHLAEALRINPVFSPLLAPAATESLSSLGEPSDELPPELRPRPRQERPAKPGGAPTEKRPGKRDGGGRGGGTRA